MKVLRVILLCGFFIVGVFVSSANVDPVDLVVWPNLGMSATGAARSIEVPLFVLVLGSVLFGLVLGGAAALFEQGRLRMGLRRAEKTTKRLKAEASAAEANMATQREEVERLSRELEGVRRELANLEAGGGDEGELGHADYAGEAARITEEAADEATEDAAKELVEVAKD